MIFKIKIILVIHFFELCHVKMGALNPGPLTPQVKILPLRQNLFLHHILTSNIEIGVILNSKA